MSMDMQIALRTSAASSGPPGSRMRNHGSLLAAASAWAALRVSASEQPAVAHAGAQVGMEAAAGRSSADAAQHGLRLALVGSVQAEARLLDWRRGFGMLGPSTQVALCCMAKTLALGPDVYCSALRN